jgi:hypothetical protein
MHGPAEVGEPPMTPGDAGVLPSTPGWIEVPPSVEGWVGGETGASGCDGIVPPTEEPVGLAGEPMLELPVGLLDMPGAVVAGDGAGELACP